jgi:ubiquinone/menaquinone biosynthesis C-methylase UbiE
MSSGRDIGAFDERAASYDTGWLGRLHHEIADRTAVLALDAVASPERVLDVGCGTGYLLRLIAQRSPGASELAGLDPAPAMIDFARAGNHDERVKFSPGVAEHLPASDSTFDLVLSTTSFDHWSDQRAGLRECARVLRPSGRLVLVDQFSALLIPTLLMSRRRKARTKHQCTRELIEAEFRDIGWHSIYAPIINAVVATI